MLNKKKQMSISEIQRELGISYKETYRHVKGLVNVGILSREKKFKEKCCPVYLKLNSKKNQNNA